MPSKLIGYMFGRTIYIMSRQIKKYVVIYLVILLLMVICLVIRYSLGYMVVIFNGHVHTAVKGHIHMANGVWLYRWPE